ncbi:MerR family transcriptional regulator [Marinitenerispora sediminis]|uniref:MerR family transcriptional regulator n=1 Tax=Marinitenerispora sediminis TaxID=1931232 RepID=A0A368T4S2_9ACTN|nr:MerR family transcriptional regulator [Marinitenerispora sediminis]RCV50296.1 MerR family transcriptional regulator [Marinitenerispora sediminis]RCV53769.1 MerR family transcriptional regulator [Marinitenerispora sediminis]RCV58058.1 MerR family transcriptional regulator [Marinitenerispora sediminis]
MPEDGGPVWKVGELARRTGLTVRTLHHYEQVGLLRPAARTAAGHRLYGAADVRRLYQVVALRELGLPLDVIGILLAGEADIAERLAEHLALVEQRLVRLRSLRSRLAALVATAESTGSTAPADLLGLIEEVVRMQDVINNYFSEEQLALLEERRRALGEDAIAAAEAEWPELIAKVQAEMDAGTDPADPRVRALAGRWMGLLEAFHGGDDGLRESLFTMYAENSEQINRDSGGPSPDMIAYISRANAAD